MARIIVVDDEYFVRLGISTMLQRSDRDYTLVGEADNGSDAIDLIMQKKPDIVFLDITMPGPDGIAVLTKVRDAGYQGYVVMLTGHEDFRLVQQAMRAGASDYILKNELAGDSLISYLDEVSEKIGRSKSEEIEDQEKKKKLEEERDFRENFLKNVFQMGGFSREEFARGAARYGLHIRPDGIYIMSIRILHWKEVAAKYKDSDLQLFFNAFNAIKNQVFQETEEIDEFYSNLDFLNVIMTFSGETSVIAAEERIRKIVHHLQFQFRQVLNIEVVIGVYRNPYPTGQLDRAFAESTMLNRQNFFYPDKNLFWSGLQHSCRPADMHKVRGDLEKKSQDMPLSSCIEKYGEGTDDLILDPDEFIRIVQDILNDRLKSYRIRRSVELSGCENLREVAAKVREAEELIAAEQENSAYSYTIRQALKFIEEHYREDITLESVAEHLSISPGYFSRIFSSEVQENFSNYIVRKRVEYAKNLIVSTNYKFYQIAEMSGFNSPVHFNHMFKKQTGVTPKEYRNQKELYSENH